MNPDIPPLEASIELAKVWEAEAVRDGWWYYPNGSTVRIKFLSSPPVTPIVCNGVYGSAIPARTIGEMLEKLRTLPFSRRLTFNKALVARLEKRLGKLISAESWLWIITADDIANALAITLSEEVGDGP